MKKHSSPAPPPPPNQTYKKEWKYIYQVLKVVFLWVERLR